MLILQTSKLNLETHIHPVPFSSIFVHSTSLVHLWPGIQFLPIKDSLFSFSLLINAACWLDLSGGLSPSSHACVAMQIFSEGRQR